MSTIIQKGLEIRRLVWKDDSFRQSTDGVLEWNDTTTGNAITFANGYVETIGTFSLTPSPAITDGDGLALPAAILVEKHFGINTLPKNACQSIRLRAKNAGSGSSVLTIKLLNGAFAPFHTETVTLASSLYTHYIISIDLSGESDVGGIRLSCDNGAIIDYVAISEDDFINQGGSVLDIRIPKRTPVLRVPNSFDVPQQLGIGSRPLVVTIPQVPVDTYYWLQDKMVNNIPLEFVTPTQQATGYLKDIRKHTEAGWVSSPLPSSDSLAILATPLQLYDVVVTLVKADEELNIDLNPVLIQL